MIEDHGPFFCENKDAWLGKGYYFWEASLLNAHWWGKMCYFCKRLGYVICVTSYDYSRENLFDLVGDSKHLENFWAAVSVLEDEYPDRSFTVPMVLGFLRTDSEFENNFDAVRAYPICSKKGQKSMLFIDDNVAYIIKDPPMQLCVWKNLRSVLISPFKVLLTKTYGFRYRW